MRTAVWIAALLTCAFLQVLGGAAGAAPADLDSSFGGDGIVAVEGPAGGMFAPESAARMAIGPHDEIFVLYSNYRGCDPPFDCSLELTVARFDSEGRLDPAYAAGPQLTVVQSAFRHGFDLGVGPDGKAVIAAEDGNGNGGLVLARLGTDGRLDGGFGVGGRVQNTGTHAIESGTGPVLAVQPDGMIVVAAEGEADPQAGTSQLLVARYLSTGQLDPGFGVGGEATMTLRGHARPDSVLLGPAGTIAVPAPLCCMGGTRLVGGGLSIARFLSNGQPDPGWPGGGLFFYPVTTPGYEDDGVEASAIGPGGTLVFSFEERSETAASVGNMSRLLPGGGIDTSFGGGRFGLYTRTEGPSPDDLAVDPDGRIVGVGWEGGLVSLFRLRLDGGTDRTFDAGQSLEVHYGSSVKAGTFQVGVQSSRRIVALGAAGSSAAKGYSLIGLRGGTSRVKCQGKRATIVGTAHTDEIVGTGHRDVIASLGGADKVRGMGGPDLICGGKGKDELLGGPGRDQVRQ